MGKELASAARNALLCTLLLLVASCSTPAQETTVAPSPTPTTAGPAVASPTPPSPLPSLTSSPLPPPAAPEVAPEPVVYTVQPGDTLLALAAEYDLPMAAIQLANGMGDSTALRAGETLVIPNPPDWPGACRYWIVHVVQTGETLVGIAATYDLELDQLQQVNELADAGRLQVGQELVLPLDAPAVALAPTATATTASPPTATPPSTEPAAPVSDAPAPTPVPASPPPADVADWPQETIRIINEVRAQHGLEPFVYNEALALAAQGQANDCAQRGWCSHTGSDGSSAKERILRAGYPARGWSECWAQSRNPQHAVHMWMDEVPPDDAHRRTLLSTWVSEIGVGVSDCGRGYYYFIADLGFRSGNPAHEEKSSARMSRGVD